MNPKPFILIPDQAGWSSYNTYPKILHFEVKIIKTVDGVIDLDDLKDKAKTGAAFIFQGIAGYFAKQNVEDISRICRENGCLVIQDVSGCIGEKDICDGKNADMMVGSFGRWKLADAGFGGFISANDDHFYNNDAASLAKHNITMDILFEKLQQSKDRFNFLTEKTKKIKNDLIKYDIVHRDKLGLNVVARFKSPEEKKELISYCKDNDLEYVTCPRYIRLDDDAISIEVKRLKYISDKDNKDNNLQGGEKDE